MDARKIVPTVAVCWRSERANREDSPLPPTHFIFIFVIFLFSLISFLLFFAMF